MDGLSSTSFMVAWKDGKVIVGPWPDLTQWSKGMSVAGCCDHRFNTSTDEQKEQILVNLFADLVLGNGCDPKQAEAEFMKIDIWRNMWIGLPGGRYKVYHEGKWSPHNPF